MGKGASLEIDLGLVKATRSAIVSRWIAMRGNGLAVRERVRSDIVGISDQSGQYDEGLGVKVESMLLERVDCKIVV